MIDQWVRNSAGSEIRSINRHGVDGIRLTSTGELEYFSNAGQHVGFARKDDRSESDTCRSQATLPVNCQIVDTCQRVRPGLSVEQNRPVRLLDIGYVATNDELVIAETAIKNRLDTGTCSQHVEDVVPFPGVDFDDLHVFVINIYADTEDTRTRDHNLIVEFGANYAQRVVAKAAGHIEIRIENVLNQVGTCPPEDRRFQRAFCGECTDCENVVPSPTKHV